MSIYLTYRLRNGKRHGPYGMSGREYLGLVTVKDDLVYSQVDGSCLGQLSRRADIPKEKVSRSRLTDVETAIRSLFDLPPLSLRNINDIKFELQSQFSDKVIDTAISNLMRKGILECVCPGNYRMMI